MLVIAWNILKVISTFLSTGRLFHCKGNTFSIGKLSCFTFWYSLNALTVSKKNLQHDLSDLCLFFFLSDIIISGMSKNMFRELFCWFNLPILVTRIKPKGLSFGFINYIWTFHVAGQILLVKQLYPPPNILNHHVV